MLVPFSQFKVFFNCVILLEVKHSQRVGCLNKWIWEFPRLNQVTGCNVGDQLRELIANLVLKLLKQVNPKLAVKFELLLLISIKVSHSFTKLDVPR